MPSAIDAEFRKVVPEQELITCEGTSLELLQKVYRDPALPLSTRMRAAAIAIPHEHPKLGVSVNIADDGTFAARLDKAIARSNGHAAKLVEGSVIEHDPMELRPGLRRRA